MGLFNDLGEILNPCNEIILQKQKNTKMSWNNVFDSDLIQKQINTLKQNKMNLQQLREGRTTKFDKFITPLKDYIKSEYGALLTENKDQIRTDILNDIKDELEEKKGVLVYINEYNKLGVPNNIINKYNISKSKSIHGYQNIKFDRYFSNKDILDDIYFYGNYGIQDSSLNNLYYLSDEKALVEFYLREIEELQKEQQLKEQQRLEERQKEENENRIKKETLTNKAIEYGLDSVDEILISKLDAAKELFGERDPKETLKLMKTLGMSTDGFDISDYYDYIQDVADDIVNDAISNHEYDEH